MVIDCRPAERREPRDVAKFNATERACALVGWEYRLVGALDVIFVGIVRWQGGYRHPPSVARGRRVAAGGVHHTDVVDGRRGVGR